MNSPNELSMVNVHEAKTHFSKLLERAHAGEEIILAKAGQPYARLVPLKPEQKPRRQPGRLKGMKLTNAFFEPLPEDELRLWEEGSPTDPLNER
ncbi:MAG: type II toxin-antitoxin system prevent-host-death family antitoxin [Sulfurisoma sp.]|nr:type II toxin-antitoxin system prevent-host-death family antitoxin [Sulfurisoma sp.]